MKAAVVPAMSSSWQIKDVPQPQPGPGQVLVKMRASGICYTDVHQNTGENGYWREQALSQVSRITCGKKGIVGYLSSETPTSCARTAQCLGCGMRGPKGISAA